MMKTWTITYKFNGVSRWEAIKAKTPTKARSLFLLANGGSYNVEILDVCEYVAEDLYSPEELTYLRKKFSSFVS